MTDATRADATTLSTTEVLPRSTPEALGIDPTVLAHLYALVETHIRDGRYPGAQVAIGRHGRLAALRTFGQARVDPSTEATDETLWLLYSQTKVVVAAAIWQLVDRGALSFADRIADHLPDFARNGKGDITLHQVLTHQGGFPNARLGPEVWDDHDLMRRQVCDFSLEWTPGSRVHYHGAAAHWIAAVLIEALTGRDYRAHIRTRLLDPLGLSDIHVGVPEASQAHCADMHEVKDERHVGISNNNSAGFRSAGEPGGGGYATAAAMAAFYQMLAAEGVLNGVRVLSPRIVKHVTRNHTGDRVDEAMAMPMHRGLGPHVRGTSPTVRGIGTIAPPTAFGHGGAGSSYSWADPESGMSFTYLTNSRVDEPFHSRRLDRISNIVHAALIEP